MKRFRIIKVTDVNGRVWFKVQHSVNVLWLPFLWFWAGSLFWTYDSKESFHYPDRLTSQDEAHSLVALLIECMHAEKAFVKTEEIVYETHHP